MLFLTVIKSHSSVQEVGKKFNVLSNNLLIIHNIRFFLFEIVFPHTATVIFLTGI